MILCIPLFCVGKYSWKDTFIIPLFTNQDPPRQIPPPPPEELSKQNKQK